VRRYRRSSLEVLRELRLPAPERRAARAERRAEAQMRAERDPPNIAERLAASREAEAARYKNMTPW
jgi:hypothetical protein